MPIKLDQTPFTSDDLRVVPYKRTKKMEIKGVKVMDYLSGKASITLDENGQIKYRITKTMKKKPTVKRNNGNNTKSKKNNQNSLDKTSIKTKTGGDHILESYESAFNQIIRDIMENSSTRYLDNMLHTNSSKIIFDEDALREIFKLIPFYWVDHLDPNRKKILCEMLILKNYRGILTPDENVLFKSIYNIMTFNDVYYKDISFKGDKKKLWGYKLATFEKRLEYIRFDEETQSFIPSNDEERKSIMKSFLKRETDKGPGGKLINSEFFDANNLIGFIELKLPQKEMEFKIRDKSTENKDKSGKLKGTQVKTGSICNNDGMKKPTVIKFINNLLGLQDSSKAYYEVEKKGLPNKDLLCLQLEVYFKYFDKDRKDRKRYFYNYEESLEFKLTKKK